MSRSHTKKGSGRRHNVDISDRNARENRPAGKLARKIASATLTHKS